MIKTLTIEGFRGFGKKQKIHFAKPNGQPGSGLTFIVGENNVGKSTIIESIQAFNGSGPISFSEGKRNKKTGGKVRLEWINENDESCVIETIQNGSNAEKRPADIPTSAYIVPSRRTIDYEFNCNEQEREGIIAYSQRLPYQREAKISSIVNYIYTVSLKYKEEFDKILREVLGTDFNWTIDQRDSGLHYIKYTQNGVSHSVEGVGDGLWSVFIICLAFVDSKEHEIVLIDEPELSAHPALQKKLMNLFVERSAERQIIISTHSSYFVNWDAIARGAQLIRVVKENGNSICHSLSKKNKNKLKKIRKDLHNPHVLGLEANEIFFSQDKIVLTEGQEDVVILKNLLIERNISLNGEFFGWGVGGADKMPIFLNIFKDLGFRHIAVILDNDKLKEKEQWEKEFKNYSFYCLPTEDIRDKKERTQKSKIGMTDDKGTLKKTYEPNFKNLIKQINEYFETKA